MNWKVYMHKTPSGGVYIGITGQSLKRRWSNGNGYKDCPIFNNAIKKYGWDNIEHSLLFDNLTQLDAKMIEQDLIYYYKRKGKSYNVTDGGETSTGRIITAELRKKMSESQKGKKLSSEAKQKISDAMRGRNAFWAKRSVLRISDSGDETEFKSITAATKSVGCHRTSITRAIKENRLCKGYYWKYK